MSDHARFAPSSAHRWLNCSASVDVVTRYPDPPTEAKQEGTAAHFLLERVLVDGGSPHDHLGKTIVVKEQGVERRFVVTREMANDVAIGSDTIRDIAKTPGVSGVEAKVDLGFIDVGMFGTTDLWHWGQDGVLSIADFKYGRLDVSAERNEQLMIYAAGVYEALKKELVARCNPNVPEPHQITLYIIQPRSVFPTPRVKVWSFPASEIEAVIDRAQDMIMEANRTPRFRAGPWCRHCPALGECPVTENNLKDVPALLGTVDMTVSDAAHILLRKDMLEKIVERAEKVMLDALLSGRYKSDDFPLITKTKHRQWRDKDLAKQRLVEEIGPQVLEPPTPAAAEKLGKEAKKIVQELSFSPPGDPAVGRAGDKRAAYLPKSAEAMFPS